MRATHDFALMSATVFRAVLQASWQGALAIGLVLLVRRAFGTRVPARWHYLLWFLVLARLLVPTFILPHSPTSLENLRVVAHPFEQPSSDLPPLPVPKLGFTAPMSLGWQSVTAQPARRPVPVPPRSHPARSWWTLAAWAWGSGVFLLGGWLIGANLHLRRRLRRQTFPVEEAIQALWSACCQRWLRRTPPRLLAADWVASPALVGWWRPTLLIPRQSLASFSTQDWEHVFSHEIAHLRWRDHWSQGFMLAAWCIHWFNPVVWLGFRRLRADRELAADEWALKHLETARVLAYGQTLFKTVANRPSRFPFQPAMVGISEDGAQMKQRLQRIASFLPTRRVFGSLAGLGALLLLAGVVLGQSAAIPGAPPKAEAKPVEKPKPSPTPDTAQPSKLTAKPFRDDLLAAARAGDSPRLDNLLEGSWKPPGKFGKEAAVQMLDDALREQDLTTFVTLHDAVKKTPYGNDWKPGDERVTSLVKAGRTDFLDALIARRLDLTRLSNLVPAADPRTAEWITRRVAEVGKHRADVETLGHAARDNDLPTLRRLLDAGVDINAVDDEENTALIETVFQDRVDAARLLLEHGAEVDKVRYPGWNYTPLCFAKSVEMAQLLKDHGANIHATLYGCNTSILTYAAM